MTDMIVVTRHPGLVDYLQARGVIPADVPVVAHATAAQVTGKHVVGVLPLSLAAMTDRVTEVALNLPPEMRGRELSATEVARYATAIRTYQVRMVTDRTVGDPTD